VDRILKELRVDFSFIWLSQKRLFPELVSLLITFCQCLDLKLFKFPSRSRFSENIIKMVVTILEIFLHALTLFSFLVNGSYFRHSKQPTIANEQ